MIPRQMRLAGPLALALFTLDCTSKQLAETHLAPEHVPYPVIGPVQSGVDSPKGASWVVVMLVNDQTR